MLVAFAGFQRSGKTLLAYTIAKYYHDNYNMPVYTNMNVPGFITISALKEIPLDYTPKILLLDEAYYFLDSRTWKNNTSSSIFFNTLGKQKILALFTIINLDTLEKRLREQISYLIFARNDNGNINYRFIDCKRQKRTDFNLKDKDRIFKNSLYDTLQVPDWIDCNLDFIKSNNDNKNNINMKGGFL